MRVRTLINSHGCIRTASFLLTSAFSYAGEKLGNGLKYVKNEADKVLSNITNPANWMPY